jgi:replicative DNA helicase
MNDFGKLPPQAIELEEAVLGVILSVKDAIIDVIDILIPGCFYKANHQIIYTACLNLFAKNNPIDILTVTEELRKTGELDVVGGAFYITNFTHNVASLAHIEYHSFIIKQKHIQRELIRISSEIQNKAFDDSIDIADLIEFTESEIYGLTQHSFKKEAVHIRQAVKETMDKIEQLQQNKKELTGISSGITQVDRITSGWQDNDLIVVAGRPSMGKSAYVFNCAYQSDVPTLIFSLEMSTLQVCNRLLSINSEYSPFEIRDGNINFTEIERNLGQLIDKPIYIDDSAALTLTEIRAKCRRLKLRYDIKLVIIDYIQLISNKIENGNREQEISSISRGLKAIAKDLDIPVIVCSQLNRALEARANKRPNLGDLRESGAIEQDADIVIFPHRPEKFGIMQDTEGNSLVGVCEIIIAKHRNGALANIPVKVNQWLSKWDIREDYNVDLFQQRKDVF